MNEQSTEVRLAILIERVEKMAERLHTVESRQWQMAGAVLLIIVTYFVSNLLAALGRPAPTPSAAIGFAWSGLEAMIKAVT